MSLHVRHLDIICSTPQHLAEICPGGFVGSSQRLRYELYRVGPAIGIPIKDGKIAPDVEKKLASPDDDDPLSREKIVWFALFEATRISIDHKTLIVFH